jgi:CheY-like chemotaxis protein
MNLVVNAAEAFGERDGTIRVSASMQSVNGVQALRAKTNLVHGKYVCLEISDDGSGMTKEVQNRIFDPFFTTKIEGRGFGLAAVQRIVRTHSGAISVASTPGVGTTFEILLPCDEQYRERVPAPHERAAEISEPCDVAILIVEDEETLRVSVARMLRKRGFTVLEAADGNAAVNLIAAKGSEIGVLLLDLMLPGKSSLEILESLQQVRSDAKVILTSAFGWETVDGHLRALRHDTFIRKPYQVDELITLVRNAILPLTTRSGQPQSVGA